ncbi:conserved hypothetical protein [Rhodococcus sp. RD6.2]|jgi:hypothetical protein|uniref:DUF2786 domain-containing protein n=1 Tax=Rhodococcus sp. RD6.2 TaxID=260936 RepID=UPI00063BBA2A|nr:DUF2786 domain-containing protein [Rhodococcus sp. RD6.2]CRK49430.1 conserved hypothetical protein [Rhodococcus sp. RD6.2]
MGRNRTDIRDERSGDDDASLLRHAYEIGWQPGDVLHVARRGLAAVELASIALLIQREAHRSGAWARAPLHWVDQLKAIADAYPRRHDEPHLAPTAARLLGQLTPLRRLCPPPSQWPDMRSDDAVAGTDAKVLGRIRGLLAKAESTEFTEEAETLTAKAQELMTRHSVTTALLDASAPEHTVPVHARRIHLDRPYSKQKGLLLTTVGDANHVRTLFNPVDAIATVVGTPADLEQVDLLFTSLLVQATRAMHTAGSNGASSAAFRRAFLYGFAVRIGQRLTEAEKSATAEAVIEAGVTFGDLLPLLARRSDAVQTEVDRLFGPALRSWGFTVSDRAGIAAGRSAADAAHLAPDRRAVTG